MENFSPEAIIKKSDMKKIYVTPQFAVIEMKYQGMLAYSGAGLGAPEFNPEGDFDMVDKYYHFGGWDIE